MPLKRFISSFPVPSMNYCALCDVRNPLQRSKTCWPDKGYNWWGSGSDQSLQPRDTHTVPHQCWINVPDVDPALIQHRGFRSLWMVNSWFYCWPLQWVSRQSGQCPVVWTQYPDWSAHQDQPCLMDARRASIVKHSPVIDFEDWVSWTPIFIYIVNLEHRFYIERYCIGLINAYVSSPMAYNTCIGLDIREAYVYFFRLKIKLLEGSGRL